MIANEYANPNNLEHWNEMDWKVWFTENKEILDTPQVIDYLCDLGWEIH